METCVYLVRHGVTDGNLKGYYMGWSEEDVNKAGLMQADRLGSRIAALEIDAVYSSPMRRALTTAEYIARPHHLNVRVREDFTELNLGKWQGLYQDDIERRWPELWQNWRIDPSEMRLPGGESYQELTARAVRGLNGVVDDNPGKHIVIVSHEAIIRVLIAHVLDVSNRVYRRLRIDNASISQVRISNRPQVLRLNDTAHIEGISGCEVRGE